MSQQYVEGYYYHPEYTDHEGRLMTKEDGYTIEHLMSQGWVDHPAKAGLNPWGDIAQDSVEQLRNDYKNGRVPGIEAPGGQTNEQRMQDHLAIHQQAAEIKKLQKMIRQEESIRKRAEMKLEELMDLKNDVGTLDPDATSKKKKTDPED